MSAREKMKKWREDRHLTCKQVSEICGVGNVLIAMIENGEVTHPKIVEKFKELYSLTDLEAEELLQKNRREHDIEYEPDKYVSPADRQIALKIEPKRQSIYEEYRGERHSEEIRHHKKRSGM